MVFVLNVFVATVCVTEDTPSFFTRYFRSFISSPLNIQIMRADMIRSLVTLALCKGIFIVERQSSVQNSVFIWLQNSSFGDTFFWSFQCFMNSWRIHSVRAVDLRAREELKSELLNLLVSLEILEYQSRPRSFCTLNAAANRLLSEMLKQSLARSKQSMESFVASKKRG